MDRYVKNFIAMSIIYLILASMLGVVMIAWPELMTLKFIHTHLMLLGWVSMMIYGVGYHILPRFAGKLIKTPWLCELQFWLANIGLVGMVIFYTVSAYSAGPNGYRTFTMIFGGMEVVSMVLFFYVMATTVFVKAEAQ